MTIVKDFVRQQGVVDHRDILAVEQGFELKAGKFKVVGFIDRVDRIDDSTIRVWDYKSSRALFSTDELNRSLQMALYHAAATQLWPWAKAVQSSFWMLRHGVHQRADKTHEQVEAALRYVETLGTTIETTSEFPARLNAFCGWCDHRNHCVAYAEALKGKRTEVSADPSDLEAIGREREEVARLAKIVYSRKEELDRILKMHLKNKNELVLNGVRYTMFPTTKVEYPLEQTLNLLSEATGIGRNDLVAKMAIRRESIR